MRAFLFFRLLMWTRNPLLLHILMNQRPYQLSTRQQIAGENHHLWNNNGTWWFHGTRVFRNGTTKRERISLRTRDLADAQRKRDRILAAAGITVISAAVA